MIIIFTCSSRGNDLFLEKKETNARKNGKELIFSYVKGEVKDLFPFNQIGSCLLG